MFLDDVAGQGSRKDTPASVNIPYRERMTLNDEKVMSEQISGLRDEHKAGVPCDHKSCLP